jgi:hypothetical protein
MNEPLMKVGPRVPYKPETKSVEVLIRDLDVVYQSMLDRLEAQTREAILMDKAVRQILDRDDESQSIMEWRPQRAISPHGAFVALARQLMETSATSSTDSPTTIDFEDLLAWTDKPIAHPGEAENYTLLREIHYARHKSLQRFWNSLTVRVAPERDPNAAALSASEDLVSAFGVEGHTEILVPYRNDEPDRTFMLAYRRKSAEMSWVIQTATLHNMLRVNHALATVCRLGSDMDVAADLKKSAESIQAKIKGANGLFRPQEKAYLGTYVQLQFFEQHVDYRLDRRVWEHVWDVVPTQFPLVRFSDSPPQM